MKKITLLTTATLLSVTCLGSHSLTAHAASANNVSTYKYGNAIIITGGNFANLGSLGNLNSDTETNCNINELLNQLMQNLPSQNLCPPILLPDCDVPETETPDNNAPETPDIEIPETPEDNSPEIEIPEIETPDHNIPNIPDTEIPDSNLPGIPEVEAPDNDENLSYAEQVVNLVNIERVKEGLAPLTVDKSVQAAAQVRAVECEQSFSHTRPNGTGFSTALKEQGVSYKRAGENIAWGQRSPEEVVNAWMNSSGHRANILNRNFTKIGVGYYQNADGVKYWSQLFIG
uniref:CAP domain-containing protein n=1 Tax=Acetatifactor sp. TaxID=1872090 RepID=UPI004055D1BC